MLEGSEFQTGGCNAKIAGGKGCADTWKRQQISVGRTQRTYGSVIIEQRTQISRLRGDENVVRQRGKFEFNALISWEPMQILEISNK